MKGLVKYDRGVSSAEMREVPEPKVIPGHVIIEVAACGICGTDLHILADEYPYKPPVVLGHEFSGTIAEVGPEVSRFRPGDRVVSIPFFRTCGRCRFCLTGHWNLCPERVTAGSGVNGGFTRYVLMPERNLFKVPDHVDLKVAALSEPLACNVRAILEETRVNAGDVAVVLGPGPIGLLAMQVARAAGARTMVCGTSQDAVRLELARTLGADGVVNIQEEDIAAWIREKTNGEGADIVLECSGAAPAVMMGMQMLRRRGQYTQIGLFGKALTVDVDQVVFKEIRMHGSFSSSWTSWKKAQELIGQKRIQLAPLVSDILPLSEWQQGFEKCRKKEAMNVLLCPEPNSP
ncbi:MAG: zinc-binding dehydrogenase [Deltaproteobacteria bacterium]|nr:zinc-binding dehydrogenase [Deltaproteobacteria bacterium]